MFTRQMRKAFTFLWVLFILKGTVFGQTPVKGILKSPQGEVVAGATIAVKDSNYAVNSNDQGEFNLKSLPQDATLIISSSGYETLEYSLAGRGDKLTIVLDYRVTKLDEVAVVSSGYQEVPKERATGSFAKIDNVKLNLQVSRNILDRLDGVTSGLLVNIGKQNNNPQNKTNVSIRGLSTINGPLDPLIVVDGFIYEGDISNINPNDVDNITVLKDAAASSIWGARAGNGVIVITLKKGKANQPLRVNFNAGVIMQSKPDLKQLNQISTPDYINLETYLFDQGYFDGSIGDGVSALTPVTEVLFKRREGLTSASDSAASIDYLRGIDGKEQYLQYIYRTAVTQQYNVGLSGGVGNNTYQFSAGYDRAFGSVQEQSDKITIRISNNFKVSQHIALETGMYYTNLTGKSGYPGYGSQRINGRQIPYMQLADDAGQPLPFALAYRSSFTDTIGGGMLKDWSYYPLTDPFESRTKNRLDELYGTIGLTYKISKAIDARVYYQYQRQSGEQQQLNTANSYTARDLVNNFSQLDYDNRLVNYIIPAGGILRMNTRLVASQTGRGQLNIHKETGDHFLNGLIGGEVRHASGETGSSTTYGYNEDPLSYTAVDYVNNYPLIIYGSFDRIPDAPYYSKTVNRFVSVFGNLGYTYKNKYTLTASARRDGSNLFGATTNDKWKPLWSIGGLWKLGKEAFYHSTVLPVLNIRATYGYSGNVDLSRSGVAVGNYTTGSGANLPFVYITQIGNPSLRWEKTGILNLALEFELKKSVLSGSVEFYRKTGKDLYGLAPYDYTAWGATNYITRNVANMQGGGIDVILNSTNVNRGLKWTSSLLLSFNKNKTTKYETTSAQDVSGLLGGGGHITPIVGKPLYAIAAYRWGGLDASGNPQGFVNGQPSTDYYAIQQEAATKKEEGNIKYIGAANPTLFGSLLNQFSYKKVSLSVSLLYKFGYYFRKPVTYYSQLVQSGDGFADYAKRWQHPDDEAFTNIPSFQYPTDENRDSFYALSEINVLKADNVRLQFLQLSFTTGETNSKSKLLKKPISIYVNASNLGILWRSNKQKIDPDYPYQLRPSKTIAVGINASF